MSCDEIRQSFDDYLDDELSARARHQVERHVTSCDGCRAELTELRSLIEAARELEARVAKLEAEKVTSPMVDVDAITEAVASRLSERLSPEA